MTRTATGTFDITMTPAAPELDASVARFELTKTFHGDLDGTGIGVMLSCGDPQTGAAGYVAIETVSGRLGERRGGFALAQLGLMQHGAQTLHYAVVPGSGSGALAGICGTFQLRVGDDGSHSYELEYEL